MTNDWEYRYRSGYATKDTQQTHILDLKLSHANHGPLTSVENSLPVYVQWNPERSPRIGRLSYRRLQVGVGRAVVGVFLEEIVRIEDVTGRVREL